MRLWLLRIFIIAVLAFLAIALVNTLSRSAAPTGSATAADIARSAEEASPETRDTGAAPPRSTAASRMERAVHGLEARMPTPARAARASVSLSLDGRHRLVGEQVRRHARLYFTEDQVGPARLSLGYRTSILVAPEHSRLSIEVNGASIATVPIEPGRGTVRHVFDIPENALRAGWNEVAISARQFHRTDCSLGSAFDVWTEIEPAVTFLDFTREGAFYGALGDLRALDPGGDGRVDVSVHAPGLRDPRQAEVFLAAVQHVGMLLDAPDLRVSVVDLSDEDATADTADLILFLGGAEALRAIPDLRGGRSDVLEAGRAVLRDRALSGAPLLAFIGNTPEQMIGAIEDVETAWRDINETHGRFDDVFGPVRAEGGETFTLEALGIPYSEARARRHEVAMDIVLPADFYAAEYGETTLRLDAAYTPEVAEGSQVSVFVNDSLTRSFPLPPGGNGRISDARVGLPMKSFRAGENRIRIVSEVLTQDDAECRPGQPAAGGARFAVFGTTRLEIPDFARTRVRPDLAGLRLGDTGTGPVALVLPEANSQIYAAAGTLMARLAHLDGAPRRLELRGSIDPQVLRGDASPEHATTLFLGRAGAIPAQVSGAAGFQPASLDTWRHVRAPAREAEAAARNWSRQEERASILGLSRENLIPWEAAREPVASETSDRLVVGHGLAADQSADWIVVAAPDPGNLERGVEDLTRQETWARLSGQSAILGEGSADLRTMPAQRQVYEGVSWREPGNLRLVLANWISSGVLLYALVVILSAVLLSIVTSALLARSGRK